MVELNRAVAVMMAFGPEAGLELVDSLAEEPALHGYHLLPSVRGDILVRLGRIAEAREELERAADLCGKRPRARDAALACGRALGGNIVNPVRSVIGGGWRLHRRWTAPACAGYATALGARAQCWVDARGARSPRAPQDGRHCLTARR